LSTESIRIRGVNRATRNRIDSGVPRQANPEQTRKEILEAAREVLAQDGKEGLSLAKVAKRAGVNRSTAYHHFSTREQLIEATVRWISASLQAFFDDDRAESIDQSSDRSHLETLNQRLAQYAIENPEVARVWLLEVLSARRPSNDPLLQRYQSKLDQFTNTEFAQPGIDTEVLAVFVLAGTFIWPLWARARARTPAERQQMAARFARELLRLCLHGSLRPEKHSALDKRIQDLTAQLRSGTTRT
jgi:AcrR family transcriptional regulator